MVRRFDGENAIGKTMHLKLRSRKGMELVQVAILVAIAVALELIFKTQITEFVSKDRKSTRLNSSHPVISYAVFCLKKKKK